MNNMDGRLLRGGRDGKVEFMRPYKFSLAIENSIWPGYATEKLVNPMFADSIPIYIGDPLASNTFDTRSYIDFCRFASLKEMFDFVREVDNDRNLYLKILATPFYRGNEVPNYARDETTLAFFDRIFAAVA